MTHTYAILEVPPQIYASIRAKLVAAGYEHTFDKNDGVEVIDMHGLALRAEPASKPTVLVETPDTMTEEQIEAFGKLWELALKNPEAARKFRLTTAEVELPSKYDPGLLPRFVNNPDFAAAHRKVTEALDCLAELGLAGATLNFPTGKLVLT